MKETLRDYKTLGLQPDILAKAEHLRTAIQSVIGEDYQYTILGMKSKTITYKRGAKVIHNRNKDTERTYTKSVETFTANEFGFFSNLNDLSKPEILSDYVDAFTIVPDEVNKDAKQLLLMRKTVNKLGQIILYKTALIFRKMSEEEKAELKAKEEIAEAESLGFTINDTLDDTLKSLASSF